MSGALAGRLRGAWKDVMRREKVRSRGQRAKKATINRMRSDMEERARTRSCTRWMRRYDDDLDWDSAKVQIPEELWLDGTHRRSLRSPRPVKMEVIKQASDEDKEIMHEVCYYEVCQRLKSEGQPRLYGWGGHDLWHENTQWTSEMTFSAMLLQVIFFVYSSTTSSLLG